MSLWCMMDVDGWLGLKSFLWEGGGSVWINLILLTSSSSSLGGKNIIPIL